jgi:hypothetical protein
MKYLEEILTIGDFLTSNWQGCIHGVILLDSGGNFDHLYGDPFIRLLLSVKNQVVVRTVNHASSRNSSWRTNVISRSTQQGLMRFREVLFGTRPLRGNWKPYTRISVYGTTSGTNQTLSTYGVAVGSGWLSPNVGSYPFWYRSHASANYLTFDDLAMFAKHLIKVNGPTKQYVREGPWIGYIPRSYCTITGLSVSENSISYSAVCAGRSSSTGYTSGSDMTYTVLVERMDSGYIRVRTTGLEKTKYVNAGDNGYHNMVPTPIQQLSQLNRVADIESSFSFSNIVSRSHHSIIGAAAGLNQTQSRAIAKMLGEVSRNFETLVESSGLPELFFTILSWPIDLVREFGSTSSILARATILIEALSKGALTWLFAIKPTLSSVKDAMAEARKLQPKYEESVIFSSDTTPFVELFPSLQSYILLDGMTPSEVKEYKIVFHSETSMRVTQKFVREYLSGLIGSARRLGVLPEPKILWALQPWSFVVDWFLPVSSLISDAQSYFASYGTPLDTLGHSVFIRVEHTQGWIYAIYIRSDNSSDPLDHVPDAWNTASVFTPAAIPLAIIQAIGFSRGFF